MLLVKKLWLKVFALCMMRLHRTGGGVHEQTCAVAAVERFCKGGDGVMPYQPHIRIVYRIGEPHEFPDDRIVHITDQPGRQADIIFRRGHAWNSLGREATLHSSPLVVHGGWRQRWTDDGRMERPALGLLLGVSRWEAVDPGEMPDGHLIYPNDYEGGSIWAVRADCHTDQLRHGMNDLLLRMVGDALWNQHWPGNHPPAPAARPAPLLAPAVTPPHLV